MIDAIKAFPQQFLYKPEIIGSFNPRSFIHFIAVGMGGSHLAADLVSRLKPNVSLTVYSDYGLPASVNFLGTKTAVILSSYSGNTEEVLAAAEIVIEKKIPALAIAVGGTLLDLAKKNHLPYIQLPDTGIQPRSALGFSLLALCRAIGEDEFIADSAVLAHNLSVAQFERLGKMLATRLSGRVPIIYASRRNQSIAYNWKIKLNETGKIPAFYNVLPELNHNEMNGFDVVEKTRMLSQNFYFIFLRDTGDHLHVQKRFDVLKKLYGDRGLLVEEIPLSDGVSEAEKIFSSLILADWTSVYSAEHYGLESEQVPLVEEFKRLITS